MHYKNNTFCALWALCLLLLSGLSHGSVTTTVSRADFSQQITVIDYLTDPRNTLSYQDIVQPDYQAAFSRWGSPQLNLEASKTTWLRLMVRNITDKNITLTLRTHINTTPSKDVEFYFQQESGTFPPDGRLKAQPDNLFSSLKQTPFDIPSGQTATVYIKVFSHHPPRLSLYLESAEHNVSSNQTMWMTIGLSLGANIILVLLALTLLAKHRLGEYSILTGLGMTILLYQLTVFGLPSRLWDMIPIPRYAFSHSMLLFCYATACQMARMILLSAKEIKPGNACDRMLLFMLFFDLAAGLFTLIFPDQFSDGFHQIFFNGSVIILTLSGIISLYSGSSYASFWLSLIIPYTVIQLTNSLTVLNVLPFNPHVIEGIQLFASLIIIMLALVMRTRVKRPHREVQDPSSIQNPGSELLINWSHLGHELRTPMNGILGMTELMSSTQLSNRQQNYLHTIQLSGQELLTLINQVVDVSKIHNGELALPSETFDPDDLIHNCIERYSYKSDQLGLELAYWPNPDIPSALVGDRSRIGRILNTIMSHALNHTEQGEIVASVARAHPEGNKEDDKLCLRFTLRATDNGAGYSSATLDLQTTDSSTGDEETPSQSGLSFARQIVEYLGGTIGCSRTDDGSVYWVNLVLLKAPDAAREHLSTHYSSADLSMKRALIVDDNDTCRNILVQQSQRLGLNVEQARDATEALAILRTEFSLGRPFNIVLLDHQMIGINGMQLAKRISEDSTFNDLRIVMLTGLSHLPDDVLLSHIRINKVLTKPVSGKKLKLILEEELAGDTAEKGKDKNHMEPTPY